MGFALLSLSYLEITNETRLKTILFVPGLFTNTRAHQHEASFHINTKTLEKIFKGPLGHDSDLWISNWCQEKTGVKLLLQVHTEFKGSLQPVYALNKCTNIDTDPAECNATQKARWYGTVCLQSPSKTFHIRISFKLVNCMGSGWHMKCNNTHLELVVHTEAKTVRSDGDGSCLASFRSAHTTIHCFRPDMKCADTSVHVLY